MTFPSVTLLGGAVTLALGMAGGVPEVGEAMTAIRALPQPEEVRRSDLELSITKMARNNPESISEVVQAWLRED